MPIAQAQDLEQQNMTVSGEQALKIAAELLQKGELGEADAILQRLVTANPDKVDRTQVHFLLGMIAAAEKDYPAAEKVLRRILDQRPDLIRVRLELARVLFEQKKDIAAAYHFRYVLGNGLPDATIKQVRKYLNAIEARKNYKISLSASLMPNSNVNAGPKDDTVTVFGLPFQLDEEAQKRSGVGLSTSLNVAAFPKLSKNLRLEARAGARVVDYANADFDDAFFSVELGPRIKTKKMTSSVLATTSRRYYAGQGYSTSYGGRLVVTTPLSRRVRFSLRGSHADVQYDTTPDRDGPVYSAGVALTRIIDKRTLGGLGVQVTREQTDANQLKNTQYTMNAYLSRELPMGITGQIRPEFYFRNFEDSGREDETYGLTLQITKRDWQYYGFAPVFSYSYLKNISNNAFFSYDRHSADVGLTRSF